MKNRLLYFVLAIGLMSASCSKEQAPLLAAFAQQLPDFSLQDPNGNKFTNKSFSKEGLVLVVTSPTYRNNLTQERWRQELLGAKADSKAPLVYLEDMQPSFFKKMILKDMMNDFESGKEPLLLIDHNGATRLALKVREKKTVVLVYDHMGKLVYSETHEPSTQAAELIWKKARELI